MTFNFASGRNFIEMLAHTVLATHAGVCRGPRFSSLYEGWKTSSPKNACVGD